MTRHAGSTTPSPSAKSVTNVRYRSARRKRVLILLVIPAVVNLPNEYNGLARPTSESATVEKIALSALASNLPVGGTTGLCHQSSVSIEQAAAWYRDHRDTAERPLIPALRRRFGISAHEAVIALREAR